MTGSTAPPEATEIVPWLERLSVRPGNRVLDVGCGRGRFAKAAAEVVGAEGLVLAADPDLGKLRALERPEVAAHFLPVAANGRDLPVRTADFDVAILGFVLHELDEPYPVLNEARRCLREEGRLLVFEWTPEVPVKAPGARRLASSEVQRLFDSAGFRVDDVIELSQSVYAVAGSMAKVLCCGAYSPVLV